MCAVESLAIKLTYPVLEVVFSKQEVYTLVPCHHGKRFHDELLSGSTGSCVLHHILVKLMLDVLVVLVILVLMW